MRHPLHPALVHFPIACWTLATAADLAGPFLGEAAWRPAGLLMLAGLAFALPAMLAGFFEWLKLAEGTPALAVAHRHMLLVLAAFACYAASLLLRAEGARLHAPGTLAIALSVAGFGCLAAAGWLGGRLVYEYGVGRRAPAADAPRDHRSGRRRS
ncbi:hypothetical protein MBSD_n1856 [Mizugakiibacter sediminis]|uniref:DUF2231 domain-containing protein n=1 Tax=Mizugakiibacter sediminis TaxID=1475481 RepID=A0A0K8QNU4_9GAMM|nr:DUF2231 domain-containing protein [Mizugakiibacter sediminis]GAP66548.1 hypothetical protein MBSD_n1856 [Mizugakiibacter sediminis]